MSVVLRSVCCALIIVLCTPFAQAAVLSTRVISTPSDRYCGWPTLSRIASNEIAVVFSGDRDYHVCPWGKVMLKRSFDEGETWQASEIIVNGILDDRDAGLTRLDNGDLVLVWFTSTAFHDYIELGYHKKFDHIHDVPAYRQHWAKLNPKEVKRALGWFASRSVDGGRTWDPPMRVPASSPHGCIQLKDGRLLIMGERTIAESQDRGRSWSLLSKYNHPTNVSFCEAHAIEGEDDVIRCYARSDKNLQYCDSHDGGRTWSRTRLTKIDGMHNPPFLSRLKDGRTLMTYGSRSNAHRGVFVRIGDANGSLESFEQAEDIPLYHTGESDMGYASTIQLDDKRFLTVFYAHADEKSSQADLMEVKWCLD